MSAVCTLCPHHCALGEGATGLCRARMCEGDRIVSANYGRVTSAALDPIEKKPLRRFFPGSVILSVGSFGCNLRCPFCQNSDISMRGRSGCESAYISPAQLVSRALGLRREGNIGIAYTYNEPLVGMEYVKDCAALAHENGLKNVLVSNGYFCGPALKEALKDIDAANIDLKGFTDAYYRKLGGDLETVKNAVTLACGICHVEITTLIVPGENDTVEEMRELSSWLAGIDSGIPLHVTRFFPRYHMLDRGPTPVEDILRLAEAAGEKLKYVYTGNI
jgi:pyruvate formate lyase activating enzyme